MPAEPIELYLADCPAPDVGDWLADVLDDVELHRTEPVYTYTGTFDGDDGPVEVTVQVTENVQGGRYTSVWFTGDALPWTSGKGCARSSFDHLGHPVVCHLAHEEDPWKMYAINEADGTRFVDRRELDL